MAQLISQHLDARQRRYWLVFMDCFGSVMNVSVSILSGPSLADKKATTLQEMAAAENAVKASALANGVDLAAQLAAGATAITAAVADAAAKGITPQG